MALTDDQRAMLQLLLERGQSYDDLAGLLGTDRPEIRRRARAALTELGGRDPDESVALSDYLLGEADPIARADAVRQLQSDPEMLALAQELAAKLQLIAPEAELPELPKGKGPVARPTAGAASESAGPLSGISKRQSRIFVALGASAVLVVAIVLAITGAFGGDEEPEATTAAETTPGETEEGTPIVLEAQQRGSDAAGLATLGFSGDNDTPAMDLQLEGLEEPPKGQAYILWFLSEDDAGFPLPTPLQLTKDGTFAERFALPEILLAILQTTRELDVGLVDLEQLQGNLTAAVEAGDDTLAYEGESVLRGELPRVPGGNAGQGSQGG
jgi:hypothetical protein